MGLRLQYARASASSRVSGRPRVPPTDLPLAPAVSGTAGQAQLEIDMWKQQMWKPRCPQNSIVGELVYLNAACYNPDIGVCHPCKCFLITDRGPQRTEHPNCPVLLSHRPLYCNIESKLSPSTPSILTIHLCVSLSTTSSSSS